MLHLPSIYLFTLSARGRPGYVWQVFTYLPCLRTADQVTSAKYLLIYLVCARQTRFHLPSIYLFTLSARCRPGYVWQVFTYLPCLRTADQVTSGKYLLIYLVCARQTRLRLASIYLFTLSAHCRPGYVWQVFTYLPCLRAADQVTSGEYLLIYLVCAQQTRLRLASIYLFTLSARADQVTSGEYLLIYLVCARQTRLRLASIYLFTLSALADQVTSAKYLLIYLVCARQTRLRLASIYLFTLSAHADQVTSGKYLLIYLVCARQTRLHLPSIYLFTLSACADQVTSAKYLLIYLVCARQTRLRLESIYLFTLSARCRPGYVWRVFTYLPCLRAADQITSAKYLLIYLVCARQTRLRLASIYLFTLSAHGRPGNICQVFTYLPCLRTADQVSSAKYLLIYLVCALQTRLRLASIYLFTLSAHCRPGYVWQVFTYLPCLRAADQVTSGEYLLIYLVWAQQTRLRLASIYLFTLSARADQVTSDEYLLIYLVCARQTRLRLASIYLFTLSALADQVTSAKYLLIYLVCARRPGYLWRVFTYLPCLRAADQVTSAKYLLIYLVCARQTRLRLASIYLFTLSAHADQVTSGKYLLIYLVCARQTRLHLPSIYLFTLSACADQVTSAKYLLIYLVCARQTRLRLESIYLFTLSARCRPGYVWRVFTYLPCLRAADQITSAKYLLIYLVCTRQTRLHLPSIYLFTLSARCRPGYIWQVFTYLPVVYVVRFT